MKSLQAYLDRIQFTGTPGATLPVLAEIQRRHVCTFPFENLDVLLGRPIRLELGSIEEKLVVGGRGGYCFEQNTLLKAVLVELGFTVTSLIARVRWQVPAEVETAQTHMILLVHLDGCDYLVDGGFGAGSLTAPLRIETEAEQPTPHEPRRILKSAGRYIHQTLVASEWADLYHFTLQPMLAVDYEVANWYTSTWPESRFKRNLVVALTADRCRHTLLNNEFNTRWMDGRSEKRQLTTGDELLEVLDRVFTLRFPAGTRFGGPDAVWPI